MTKNKNKKNILLITDYANKFGGAEKSFLRLINGVISNKSFNPICLFFSKGQLYQLIKAKNIPCYLCNVPYIQRPITFKSSVIYLIAIVKFFLTTTYIRLKHEIDIVYCNKSTCIIYAFIASWLNRLPCVWHVRNPNKNFGFIGKFIVNHISAIIFNSKFTQQPFEQTFGNLKCFHVIYNGTEEVSSSSRCNIETIKTIGMVAHFSPWKNHSLFLKAIPNLIRKHPELNFLIFGDILNANPEENKTIAKYKERLLDLIKKLKIEDKVKFCGYEENSSKIYPQIDLLVHPTTDEPFGLIIIEAMSYGIPVVAANSGGPAEIIESGKNGLLFQENNLKSLIEQVESLINNKEIITPIVHNGFESINNYFSFEIYSKKIINLLNKIALG